MNAGIIAVVTWRYKGGLESPMEQKRPVIDQPSRCSLLILPFESRRSIEFSPAFERERATGRPDKRGPEKKERKERRERGGWRGRRIEIERRARRNWAGRKREENSDWTNRSPPSCRKSGREFLKYESVKFAGSGKTRGDEEKTHSVKSCEKPTSFLGGERGRENRKKRKGERGTST